MTFEVEMKAWLRDPAAVEALAARRGPLKKESYKEDVYFRRAGETDPLPKDRFRLRREGEQAVVTFKDKIMADGVEVNREIEFSVDAAFAFFQFAHRFGFEPFVVKRKKSRVYQLERASVEFNEVEHLGHFIEIEILVEAEAEIPLARVEIARIYTQLGLDAANIESRYYILLLQEAYPAHFRFVDDPALDWPFEEVLP